MELVQHYTTGMSTMPTSLFVYYRTNLKIESLLFKFEMNSFIINGISRTSVVYITLLLGAISHCFFLHTTLLKYSMSVSASFLFPWMLYKYLYQDIFVEVM